MTDHRADITAVALISGGGSNLQALIDAIGSQALRVRLAAVVSNIAGAHGLSRARMAGIDALTLPSSDYPDRDKFDRALASAIEPYQPQVILLAGFMRILGPWFVHRHAGRIINIHPSLLPKYAGLHTHQRALDDGETEHGCTVHYVTEELDGGPRIVQGRVAVQDGDDAARLAARVLVVEHKIYPHALALIASGRLCYKEGEAWLDGKRLREPVEI